MGKQDNGSRIVDINGSNFGNLDVPIVGQKQEVKPCVFAEALNALYQGARIADVLWNDPESDKVDHFLKMSPPVVLQAGEMNEDFRKFFSIPGNLSKCVMTPYIVEVEIKGGIVVMRNGWLPDTNDLLRPNRWRILDD